MRRTIGKLDQRVIIEEISVTNNSGSVSNVYNVLGTVWAEVIALRGREAFEAARTQAHETIRVRVRYRDDIGNTNRAVWMNQNYNIVHIDRSQKRDGFLWFTAEAKDAN